VDDVQGVKRAADALGFNETEFAFYGILKSEEGLKDKSESDLQEITQKVVVTIGKLAVIDWTMKDDVQRQMRRDLKKILRTSVPENRIEPVTLRLIDLARHYFVTIPK
jgi:type I restriction enzyme R subunit